MTKTYYKTIVLFVLFLGIQALFWTKTSKIYPDLAIVPNVPGVEAIKTMGFGDDEFMFRLMGFNLQTAGDTFGRFTALYKYDYAKLYQWFSLMDLLDNKSDFIPVMATYYYSQTQHTPDVRYVVDYLYDHAADRPEEKWWWLLQAVYLADKKLGDTDLAWKMAQPLIGNHDVPILAQQLPALVLEKRGEFEAAYEIMKAIKENADELSYGEINYMRYFVEERLGMLEKLTGELGLEPWHEQPSQQLLKEQH
jgi:hypothetical protein